MKPLIGGANRLEILVIVIPAVRFNLLSDLL